MSDFRKLCTKKHGLFTMQLFVVGLIALLALSANAHAITDWAYNPFDGTAEAATDGEFPYYTRLGLCGGTMVAPNWILTAKHCVINTSDLTRPYDPVSNPDVKNMNNNVSLNVGYLNEKNVNYNLGLLGNTVTQVHIFDDTVYVGAGDVALIQLNADIADENLPLVNLLNDFGSFDTNLPFSVIGAGKSTYHSQLDTSKNDGWHMYGQVARNKLANHGLHVPNSIPYVALRKAENMSVTSASNSQQLAYRRANPTNSTVSDAGSCNQDSGGPVLMYDNGIPYQVGVVSHASMCYTSRTNRSSYAATIDDAIIDWIVDTIKTTSDQSDVQSPYMTPTSSVTDKIEAVHYDYGGEGVAYHDKESRNKGGSRALRSDEGVDEKGQYVHWFEKGEWIEYTVQVPENAVGKKLSIQAHVASRCNGASYNLPKLSFEVVPTHLNTSDIVHSNYTQSVNVNVPNTRSWSTYKTVAGANQTQDSFYFTRPGTVTVRMEREGGGCYLNVDWFEFTEI